MFACRTTSKSNRVRKGEGRGNLFFLIHCMHVSLTMLRRTFHVHVRQLSAASPRNTERPGTTNSGIAEWIVFYPRIRGGGRANANEFMMQKY